MVNGFYKETSLMSLNRNPISLLLDFLSVPPFGENQVFKGRGIFKDEENVSQGNGSKNDII
jgi:hypothetical protein